MSRMLVGALGAAILIASGWFALLAVSADETTYRVSVNSDEEETDGAGANFYVSLSADGKFAVFGSHATNLVPDDTNIGDVYLRDIEGSTTERISVNGEGTAGNSDSGTFATKAVSADGRFVVFWPTQRIS